MYFNDQLEHYVQKIITPVPYILMLVEIVLGSVVEWKLYIRNVIHVIQFLTNAAR